MINFERKESYGVEDLRNIVRILRHPGGCPWDREQSHESIRRNFIEEAYEVAEAIDQGDPAHLREELGDVLLQVLFHASIEEDAGRFDLDGVADGICKKLLFRHPHVFGDQTALWAGEALTGHPILAPGESLADGEAPTVEGTRTREGAITTGEVLVNWEELKRREKGQATHADVLRGVARSLPGLWRAEKIQAKAEAAGFEWPGVSQAMDKLAEELSELQTAVAEESNVKEELGDLLFAAVKIARFFQIDAEEALAGTCEKFIRRFAGVEAAVTARGATMQALSVSELMALWDREKDPEKEYQNQMRKEPES